MATVDNRTTYESNRWIRVVLQNQGTDESGGSATKIGASELVGPDGLEGVSLALWEAIWDVSGFGWVKVLWDHATDDEALLCSGSNAVSYESIGGKPDPQSPAGSILVQTQGVGASNVYHLELLFKKKQQ